MKRIVITVIIVLIYITLLANGCASEHLEDVVKTEPTVLDIFAETTLPAQTTVPESHETEDSNHGVKAGFVKYTIRDYWRDSKGYYLRYEGGDMVVKLEITASGTRVEHDMGILLFVDGQIQPYKTPNDDTYRYMHVVSPEDGIPLETDLIFVPIAGKKGDTLEVWYSYIYWPDYSYLEDGLGSMVLSSGAVGGGSRLMMETTPMEMERLQVKDRVISWTVSQVPLASRDTVGWTEQDFQEKYEYSMEVNPDDPSSQYSCYIWNVSEETPLKVRFELWGNSYVSYGLVLFVDNEPVSVAPEDQMLLAVENGYKTVVEAELDMAGFDGESSIYAALIPQNYFSAEVLTMSWVEMTNYYLLFDECPIPDMQ